MISVIFLCLLGMATAQHEVCNGKTGVVPSPDNCAQYYMCGSNERVAPDWPPGLKECTFPKLYDAGKGSCEEPQNVDCGHRYEPKSECGYYWYQCKRATCVSCSVRYPTCEGEKDGLQPWVGRPNSPYYVECYDGRVISQHECPQEGGWNIFDPNKKMCVPLNINNPLKK